MKRSCFAVFFLSLGLLFQSAFAESSVSSDLPISNYLYDQLDVLVGHGLVTRAIVGQRPYSRQEVQRLIAEAKQKLSDDAPSEDKHTFLVQVLDDLERSFVTQSNKVLQLNDAELKAVHHTETYRFYPIETRSFIGGTVHPLSRNQNGITFPEGGSFFLRTHLALQVNPHVVFQTNPRLQWQALESGQGSFRAHMDELAVKVGAWNIELGLGRQQQVWGQSRLGGLAFSNNARAFDMVRLKNISPVQLPILGDLMGTFFYGTLGPDQTFAYTHLTGFKLTCKPVSSFEFGAGNVTLFQGKGAPNFSFAEGLQEWFGFIPGISQTSQQFSNRMLFFDSRLVLPFLRYSSLYGEWAIEDRAKMTTLKKTFLNDSSYVLGLFIPRLSGDGRWQARFESKYFGRIAYRHDLFQDGYTLNGKVLGDALGIDAHSHMLEVSHFFSPQVVLRSQFEFQSYDDNGYAGQDYHTVRDGLTEKRLLLASGFRFPLAKTVFLQPELKYEYVKNFAFQSGLTKHFSWASISLQKLFH